MNDIERRIRDRGYSSPQTASAAVKRSKLKGKARARAMGLVQEWADSGRASDVVVGGLPPAPSVRAPDSSDFLLHVGVTDVICQAKITLNDRCLHVELTDGVRQLELGEEETRKLYRQLASVFGGAG